MADVGADWCSQLPLCKICCQFKLTSHITSPGMRSDGLSDEQAPVSVLAHALP